MGEKKSTKLETSKDSESGLPCRPLKLQEYLTKQEADVDATQSAVLLPHIPKSARTVMDPTYPLVPVISFICAFLALSPLPWLIAHWNTGAWMYAVWVSLGCLNSGINEIIWKDNTNNIAPVWCDISTRIMLGESVGIPAASLTITRRIYLMFSLKSPLAGTRAEKKKVILFDLGLTIGLPILQMIVFYVVQGHRFNIIEELGCALTNVKTWVVYPLQTCWPLVCGLISCGYCIAIIRIYLKRRRNLSKLGSPTDFSKYYRVLALGCADAVFTVPCSTLLLAVNIMNYGPDQSWPGWAAVHEDFSRVDRFPAILWKMAGGWDLFNIRWNMWVSPACAFIFFCFFGLTREVREGHVRFFVTVCHKLGFKRFTLRKRKQPEPAPDVSDFRVVTIQRSTNHVTLDTSMSISTVDIAGYRGTTSESASELDLKYTLPPFEKDVMKPIDLTEQV